MMHTLNESERLKEKFGKIFINRPEVDWNNVYEDENENLVCGKCGKKKTTLFAYPEILGLGKEEKRIYTMCDCDTKKYEEEKRAEEEQKNAERVVSLKARLALDPSLQDLSLSSFDLETNESFAKAHKRASLFVERFKEFDSKGYGIYFYGNKGTGKTSLMAAMANELIEKYRVIATFYRLQDLFDEMRRNREGVLKQMRFSSALFLDDVGTERFINGTGADLEGQSMFYDIISARLSANKPTVFSSNYTIADLEKKRGLRSASADRLFQLSTAIVKIEGESYRRIIRDENVKNLPF